jgi:hypothetical protein
MHCNEEIVTVHIKEPTPTKYCINKGSNVQLKKCFTKYCIRSYKDKHIYYSVHCDGKRKP